MVLKQAGKTTGASARIGTVTPNCVSSYCIFTTIHSHKDKMLDSLENVFSDEISSGINECGFLVYIMKCVNI